MARSDRISKGYLKISKMNSKPSALLKKFRSCLMKEKNSISLIRLVNFFNNFMLLDEKYLEIQGPPFVLGQTNQLFFGLR